MSSPRGQSISKATLGGTKLEEAADETLPTEEAGESGMAVTSDGSEETEAQSVWAPTDSDGSSVVWTDASLCSGAGGSCSV